MGGDKNECSNVTAMTQQQSMPHQMEWLKAEVVSSFHELKMRPCSQLHQPLASGVGLDLSSWWCGLKGQLHDYGASPVHQNTTVPNVHANKACLTA